MSDEIFSEQIAKLEQLEVQAILSGDKATLGTLWHPDYLVNAPHNQLTRSADEVISLVAAGVIAYDRFDRVCEGTAIHGDVAIAMGHEVVTPKNGPQAGQTLTRRYSNIWWHDADGGWRMIARHANVVGQTQNLDLPE